MEIQFYSIYGSASLLMVIVGLTMISYLKKAKMNYQKTVLGASVFWLYLSSVFLILLGSLTMISVLVTFYFDLKLNDYL
jgi:hypothetical protein